jgi:hypothetical protein
VNEPITFVNDVGHTEEVAEIEYVALTVQICTLNVSSPAFGATSVQS